MVKKIAFIVFSLGILLAGIYGFRKLNYWERSAWVFKYKTADRRFEGRGGRPGGDFRERPEGEFRRRPEGEFRQRPEGEFRQGPEGAFGDTAERSVRASRDIPQREFRQGPGGDFSDSTQRVFRDSTRSEFRSRSEGEFRQRPDDRASFGPGDRGRGGHGRGDFRGGQKIRLRNVWWFLGVFSAFTVVALYLDRIWLHIRKKRKHSTT